jgi:hypothetical protein
MNDGHARLFGEDVAVELRIGVAVAREHDLRAHRLDGVHLDLRRCLRHHDDGAQLQTLSGVGDALGVVASAGGDDAAGALAVGEVRDLVVGTAQLETENRLQVLALEHDLVAQARRQTRRRRRAPSHAPRRRRGSSAHREATESVRRSPAHRYVSGQTTDVIPTHGRTTLTIPTRARATLTPIRV